jgi:hypothetical protein
MFLPHIAEQAEKCKFIVSRGEMREFHGQNAIGELLAC